MYGVGEAAWHHWNVLGSYPQVAYLIRTWITLCGERLRWKGQDTPIPSHLYSFISHYEMIRSTGLTMSNTLLH